MVLSGSKAQIAQGKSAIEQRIVMVLGMKMAEKVLHGARPWGQGRQFAPNVFVFVGGKCGKYSEIMVEFHGFWLFLG